MIKIWEVDMTNDVLNSFIKLLFMFPITEPQPRPTTMTRTTAAVVVAAVEVATEKALDSNWKEVKSGRKMTNGPFP